MPGPSRFPISQERRPRAVRERHRPRVYRNDETGWDFPFFFNAVRLVGLALLDQWLLPNLGDAGLEVPSVGVKGIILPSDVRELMNRVIEAEKTAQANVIKRREETAATRSLLNTAKLMEDNPVLLRLKELEALE